MRTDTVTADIVLDVSGLSCPMPLLKTKKTLATMASGEILEVISTDPGSQKDLPRFGGKGSNRFLGMADNEDGTYIYYIQKG